MFYLDMSFIELFKIKIFLLRRDFAKSLNVDKAYPSQGIWFNITHGKRFEVKFNLSVKI
jgi:hypothetical protein